jgi:2-keto-myo-inositol isomerase
MGTSFAFNHMVAPKLQLPQFFGLARELGIRFVEIRNDLHGVAIANGSAASDTRSAAAAAGVEILSINALQRFNEWNDRRATEATTLARYARDCGAKAVVLCPVNDREDRRSEDRRLEDLRLSLKALAPILREHGVLGLVEPLGFEESSLRRKRMAADAITAVREESAFQLVHDTFHHYLAGETELFPEWTGLVHISGVEDRSIPLSLIRDSSRVLVRLADIVGNVAQIRALRSGGYRGPFSFEPFAESVHCAADIASALRESLTYLEKEAFR